MAKTLTKEAKPKVGKYSITLKLNGVTETHTGDNVHEILTSFKMPVAIKSDAKFHLVNGERTKDYNLSGRVVRRTMVNKYAVELLAKRFTDFLD